jgi:acyl-CoA thioester hydrolase
MQGHFRRDYLFFLPIQTRFNDNDIFSHVNNSVFFEFFDTCVNSFLLRSGHSVATDAPVRALVVDNSCSYFKPLSFHSSVTVGMRVSRVGATSVTYELAVFDGNDERASAAGQFVHVFVDRSSGKPVSVPKNLLASFAPVTRSGDITSPSGDVVSAANIIPETMLVAVLRQCGGHSRPFALSKPLSLERVKVPVPQAGYVLVKVERASLCHSDLSVVDGTRPRPMPMAIGHEGAGIVVAVGAQRSNDNNKDENDIRLADHVVFAFVPSCQNCSSCKRGRPVMCEPGEKHRFDQTDCFEISDI